MAGRSALQRRPSEAARAAVRGRSRVDHRVLGGVGCVVAALEVVEFRMTVTDGSVTHDEVDDVVDVGHHHSGDSVPGAGGRLLRVGHGVFFSWEKHVAVVRRLSLATITQNK